MECGTINKAKADEVLRLLSSNDQHSRRMAQQMLRDIQQNAKARRKRIKVFQLTVQALDRQYAERQFTARQQLSELDTLVADLNHQVARLRQQRSEFDQQVAALERQLQSIREYVQQRRTKKTKREKQYNHFYFVPIVSKRYHKKYIRARDKNADAEQQLLQLRESIDEAQAVARQAAGLLTRKQQEHDAKMEERQAVHDQVAEADRCLAYLHEGQKFWDHFDEYQVEMVLQACSHIIDMSRSEPQLFLQKKRRNDDQGGRDWKVLFQTACHEYGEREAHGLQKWDRVEVEFECARCRQSLVGWPIPDKVHTADLLCAVCYQDTRTSMIMEKKIHALGGKLGLERPASLEGTRRRSSSSSRSSNSSSNTAVRNSSTSVLSSGNSTKNPSLSSSSSSFVDDAKKLFKGVLSPSKSTHLPQQQHLSVPSTTDNRPLPPLPPEAGRQPYQKPQAPPPYQKSHALVA